ncbi:stage III sporulation protein AA [Novisyntrophococcus fermenticellae]|uniref:stage III sporulation protein AA n=1 Tax=Novisyntrophococcus fermenticellae TaxID=2068655 RepID=UPI002E76D495|nr:stage III sporulation protein AA [Novisyntrophococcus fermenticellae]
MRKADIIRLFAGPIRNILEKFEQDFDRVYEIRLRIGAPLQIIYDGRDYFLKANGGGTFLPRNAYIVTSEDVCETMEYIGNYSLYAFEDELRQGFLTVQGGHRVGIAGQVIVEDGKVKGVSPITCVNVRLSHQILGCGDTLFPYLWDEGEFCHTLIISAPRCGKTTLLRDIVRQLSDGNERYPGMTVGVVDERSEIAGCYQGIPQNDVGIRTDVLDGCPKAEGMMMLIRSMSPQVVAVDEIGTAGDIKALESVLNCGCKILATIHGNTIDDVRKKPLLSSMVNAHIFERYVLLSNRMRAGTVQAVYDGRGTCLFERERFAC